MVIKQSVSSPIYRQIAIAIAKDIAEGKYVRGQRLFGRSVLASQYRVSPETVRKAVFLLKDVGILDTEKGSGIEVVSKEKAIGFLQKHIEVENIASIKNEISDWANRQAEEADRIVEKIQMVVNAAERLDTVNPFHPYQIVVKPECSSIGKTINDVQFWHCTGATIIAIRRGEKLILSPGPYATFSEGDIIFIIGSDMSYLSAEKLLNE